MLSGPDPTRVDFFNYVIVFDDDAPPKQCDVQAMSDDHAVKLLEREYPAFRWKLYRAGSEDAIHAHAPQRNQHSSLH